MDCMQAEHTWMLYGLGKSWSFALHTCFQHLRNCRSDAGFVACCSRGISKVWSFEQQPSRRSSISFRSYLARGMKIGVFFHPSFLMVEIIFKRKRLVDQVMLMTFDDHRILLTYVRFFWGCSRTHLRYPWPTFTRMLCLYYAGGCAPNTQLQVRRVKGLPTEMANAPMRAMRFARGLLIMATWHDHRILLLASWCTYLGDGMGERCEEMGFEREVSHYFFFRGLKCMAYRCLQLLVGTCRNDNGTQKLELKHLCMFLCLRINEIPWDGVGL